MNERKSKIKCKELLKLMAIEETKEENWSNFGQVKKQISSIPNAGFGVFASVDFEDNDIITEYIGKKITNEKVLELTYGNQFHYIAQLDSKTCIDGKRTVNNKTKLGSMINDIRIQTKTNCALFRIKSKLYIIATKKIKTNEEFFLNYGKKYWDYYEIAAR